MRMLWYWPFARPEEMAWAKGVVELGHDVSVMVVDREGAPVLQDPDRPAGLRVLRFLPDVDRAATAGPAWMWSRALTYVDRARTRHCVVRDGHFDLVHYHYLNRFTDCWFRPRGMWVVSVHDVVPHRPRLGPLERRLLKNIYERPDGLIVHHEWLRIALQDEFGIPQQRVRVVPLPVFPVDRPQPRSTDDEPPTVLFFGALRENKGLEVLLEAMSLSRGQMRLHIAGRGHSRIEQLAVEAAEANPYVTVEIGRIGEARKADLFRACAVVALPYTSFSSQSGVLHDAYGHERPVVVTDVGALGDTVRTDGTGLVVQAGNAEDLAKALMRMSSPEGDASVVSARRIASERSPSNIASMTVEAYDYFATSRS